MKGFLIFCLALSFLPGMACDDNNIGRGKCVKCFKDCMKPAYMLRAARGRAPNCDDALINYFFMCEGKCGCVAF
jgi:hypothetical protein